MRRQGPITIRHIFVAVLVVFVINAQLTWWIVFVLRLNRSYLEAERQRVLGAAKLASAQVSTELEIARNELLAALITGARPGRDRVPAPFQGWRMSSGSEACPEIYLNVSDSLEMGWDLNGVCFTAVVSREWRDRRLDLGPDFEILPTDSESTLMVPLERPFTALSVGPSASVWEKILDEYRRRIVMMVSEGSFFAVLLMILLALLWRTFRREIELQRQHRNFLSAITHELKSPLAAMRLALETVVSGRAESDDSERFLANALEDTGRLQDLVQKVLEATRFGEGRSQLRRRHADLSDLVEGAIDIFSRRTLGIAASVQADLVRGLCGDIDEEAIGIVVSNLLENAVKYGGDPPLVEVRLDLCGRDAVLEVGDNGCGISPEDAPLIFGRFFRGGDEMTRTTRGTGLGLYLVQQIVMAHGGKVEVAETGQEGTVFRVSLPGFVEEEGEE